VLTIKPSFYKLNIAGSNSQHYFMCELISYCWNGSFTYHNCQHLSNRHSIIIIWVTALIIHVCSIIVVIITIYSCSGQVYRPLTDQFNWSGSFSLVVYASGCCAGNRGIDPRLGTM